MEKKPECERATKMRQRLLDRLDWIDALGKIAIDQVQDDLGIGLGLENRSFFLQGFAQFAKILDDAVVDHGDVVGRMRMRVALGRLAVGGPAGVADAGVAGERLGFQSRFQILELAFGAAPLKVGAFQRRGTCGIVAAIFKALERIHNLIRNPTAPQNADNAAPTGQYPQLTDKFLTERSSLLT